MKITMLVDADHRISSALTQSFRANHQYNLPRKTADALIKRGVAEPLTETRKDD